MNKTFVEFSKAFGVKQIDIAITTFNRLPYLINCVTSIVASTVFPYRIFIWDDKSNDGGEDGMGGTVGWLKYISERHPDWIHYYYHAKVNVGTATALNSIIDRTESNVFVFSNDDMWFHRGWEEKAMEIFLKYKDCGMVSLFDWSALGKVGVHMGGGVYKTPVNGLGATMIYRPLWDKTSKFYLPAGQKMGFFSSRFCGEVGSLDYQRNKIYAMAPSPVEHMDLVGHKLCERENSDNTGYTKWRVTHKGRGRK